MTTRWPWPALAGVRLGPLDPAAAAALLDTHGVLDPMVRRRVLAQVAGSPLALAERPRPASSDSARAWTEWIPLTRRLEQAFASRLPGLPAVTFTALLAAGLNDGDALAEALAAASQVAGAPVSVADLTQTATAGWPKWTSRVCTLLHPCLSGPGARGGRWREGQGGRCGYCGVGVPRPAR